MERGAKILVETCASIRAGEQVVIVTDAERERIACTIANAVASVGGVGTVVVSPPRSIDNEEPIAPVAEAMKKASVILLPVTHALAHTVAVRTAIAEGARVVSMSAFTERMMREGGLFADFVSRRPLCQAMALLLTEAKHVKVTNPAGTNLSFSIERRPGNSHACIVDGPGFTAVPNIEANTSPVEGTTEGTLVVDGSIPYYGVGVIETPVRFEISGGFVRTIEGGAQAELLWDLLARQNDEWVYNIAQFAIGLNPECRDFTGEMLNDEGVNGTIHIGIGTSSSLGGVVQAKTHFDAIIRKPTVWFDGEAVIQDGEVLADGGVRPRA